MLPTMKIGDIEITRLIVGSNPFTGKSHLTPDVDADMKGYFSEEAAFAMLRRCEEAGINAVQSRGSMPIMGLLGRYRAAGGKLLWMAQSGKNLTTFDEELDEMMRYDPAAVCIHGELADELYMTGMLDRLEGLLDKIRRKNVPCGICAHFPEVLATFVGKITRRVSLNKWHSRTRKKRGGGQVSLALEELEECISTGNEVEKSIEHKELLRLINTFLGTLPETERDLFVCRYWFFASIQELSEKFSFSESKTKSMLFRTREKLKNCLEKEGYLS